MIRAMYKLNTGNDNDIIFTRSGLGVRIVEFLYVGVYLPHGIPTPNII